MAQEYDTEPSLAEAHYNLLRAIPEDEYKIFCSKLNLKTWSAVSEVTIATNYIKSLQIMLGLKENEILRLREEVEDTKRSGKRQDPDILDTKIEFQDVADIDDQLVVYNAHPCVETAQKHAAREAPGRRHTAEQAKPVTRTFTDVWHANSPTIPEVPTALAETTQAVKVLARGREKAYEKHLLDLKAGRKKTRGPPKPKRLGQKFKTYVPNNHLKGVKQFEER